MPDTKVSDYDQLIATQVLRFCGALEDNGGSRNVRSNFHPPDPFLATLSADPNSPRILLIRTL